MSLVSGKDLHAVNYNFATAKVSKTDEHKIDVQDTEGKTHKLSFKQIIEYVGNEIQQSKNQEEIGKAQKSLEHVEKLNIPSNQIFVKIGQSYMLAEDAIQNLKSQLKEHAESIKKDLHRVNYNFATVKISKTEDNKVEVQDTEGKTHKVSFTQIIKYLEEEIQQAKNQEEIGKAQNSLEYVKKLNIPNNQILVKIGQTKIGQTYIYLQNKRLKIWNCN